MTETTTVSTGYSSLIDCIAGIHLGTTCGAAIITPTYTLPYGRPAGTVRR